MYLGSCFCDCIFVSTARSTSTFLHSPLRRFGGVASLQFDDLANRGQWCKKCWLLVSAHMVPVCMVLYTIYIYICIVVIYRLWVKAPFTYTDDCSSVHQLKRTPNDLYIYICVNICVLSPLYDELVRSFDPSTLAYIMHPGTISVMGITSVYIYMYVIYIHTDVYIQCMYIPRLLY